MATKGALQTGNERQLFLLRLSDALRPLADPVAIQYQAARVLGEYLRANRVGYAEDQGDHETIVITRNYTDGVPGIEGRYRYIDYGLALWTALQAGRTVVRSDIANEPTLSETEKAAYAALQLGASVNAPLVKAGRLVALLFVHFAAAHEWSSNELTLIDETAERTWAAVERARAEAALHKSEADFRQIFELTGVGMAQVDPYTLRFLLVNDKLSEITGYTTQELLTLTTTALTHPDDRSENQIRWAKTFSGETAQFAIEKRYVRKDGRVIWVSVIATLLRDEAGKPQRAISSIKEITERKEAEAQLQRVARFDAFRLALADALRPLTDPLAIQAAAMRVVGEHLQADRVFYGEVTADGAAVVVADNYVRTGVAKLVGRIPMRDEQANKLRAGQTRLVTDVATTTELLTDEKAMYQALGIVASVAIPLVKQGRWVSNLGVHQQSARVWQPDEIAMLAETADRTWDAVERARAEAALQQLNATLEQQVETRTAQVRALASSLTMAEQAERRQLSQILHDDLQQRLYGMQMRMMTILNDLQAGNTTRLAHYAQQVYDWMGDAIQTTRQLTVDLSPPVLKHEGLADALQRLVTQMAEMNGLQVRLQAVEAVSIPDENMRVLLFQIVRELLFNVVKHAKTDQVRVELSKGEKEECVIIVRDEGRGFDVTATPGSSSFGLFSVRERLQLFGGRMTIQSAPNQGTQITIHAPIGATTPPRKEKDTL